MAVRLKVKIKRTQTAGGTHYDYPPEYEASKVHGVVFETIMKKERYDEVVARGNDYEYIMCVVKDIDAPAFLESADITELTKEEADTLGETWIDQIVKTTDQSAVNGSLARYALGQELTVEEKAALDPDDDTPGLLRSKTFTGGFAISFAKVQGRE